MLKTTGLSLLTIIMILSLSGCSNFDGQAERKTHAKDFKSQITDKTSAELAKKEALCLGDCIQIALENNLEIRASKIKRQIAKLERKISFAGFLPAVNLDYGYTRWDRQPKMVTASGPMATHDQSVRTITWQMQMSIFDPSTWFLYAMHKRGEEIADIVTKYTKQITILEITINYYHCLSLQQAEASLQSQLNAAAELEKELAGLLKEGMITEWQYEQAGVITLARKTELSRTQYAVRQAKGDLLVSMGLAPFADIKLKVEEPLKVPDQPLEDLVCDALIQNLQLYVADEQIEIAKEKVKVALAQFLPRLTLFANQTNTSDSFQLYGNSLSFGLAGTMTIFNGFANINEYKAAKERRKQAYLEREQQTLVLMLEVLKAHLNLENAKEENALAQKAFGAASKHLTEVDAKWKEGLVQSSEKLDVMAQKDSAQTDLMISNFNLQVNIATLQNIIGATPIPDEEKKL